MDALIGVIMTFNSTVSHFICLKQELIVFKSTSPPCSTFHDKQKRKSFKLLIRLQKLTLRILKLDQYAINVSTFLFDSKYEQLFLL